MRPKDNHKISRAALILIVGVLFLLAGCTDKPPETSGTPPPGEEVGGIDFYDVKSQAPEFISYYNTITLTAEQEKIKEEALTPIPAPCCSDFSMYTCCCVCSLSETVWGLSNYLITEQNYNTEQLNAAVLEWISFTNEDGYAGDACSKGRCNSPFKEDGCGGMGGELIV